ncbi:glycosyltransferase family 4 protein [Sutcliffiella horikoshii]|uniref:Glycosyltransferase family 4 protein n=1 Tax=Sutcliffiella horikoshii TaxID=79883 RepID=A0AA94WSV1_9BACI|nr:glycosyltransferase family 4 protein [Sutcliffiella horikoshii]TYS60069.1 glycosyltransferase family 4 protein [Sutcliffiella horikoshii]
MSKKILFCATVDYHFKAFHLPTMKWFKEQGWEVHVAASGNTDLPFTDKKHTIPIQRSPFRKDNMKAYQELKAIIDQNQYRIIHCHTPLGGVLTRLAAREARKKGTKVLYTAHGFHFCKGAPYVNWLLYYPTEKKLAAFTDCLITINREDYVLAVEQRFPSPHIELVNGVGVDTTRYQPVTEKQKKELRLKLGFKQDDFLLFYAAEFNKNKNQKVLINAMAILKDELPKARLLLAGEGPLLDECKSLAQTLGVDSKVEFLGFRKDIAQILPACDIAVGSSFREGLPVNIMEAMACGLPVVASDNRGHRELVFEEYNGFLIANNDSSLFANRIQKLFHSIKLRTSMGNESLVIMENYSLINVTSQLIPIYKRYMLEDSNEPKIKHHSAYI